MGEVNYLGVGIVGGFPAFAAYSCFYAGLTKLGLSAQRFRKRLWLACLFAYGSVLLVAAGSLLGVILAWVVTAVCSKPYYVARFRRIYCECYGSDYRFLIHSFPWLLGLGFVSSILIITWSASSTFPPMHAWMSGAWWIAVTVGVGLRSTVKLGAPFQAQPYRKGTTRSSDLAPATVLFWGSMTCAPCVEASSDLVSMLQAFPNRVQAAMALEGYPDDAARHFKGVSIVTLSQMRAVVPFEQTPSLALVDQSGQYKLFEGLPNVRLGIGYLLRGF